MSQWRSRSLSVNRPLGFLADIPHNHDDLYISCMGISSFYFVPVTAHITGTTYRTTYYTVLIGGAITVDISTLITRNAFYERDTGYTKVIFGLSKERPILGDHPKAHIHEIRRISHEIHLQNL